MPFRIYFSPPFSPLLYLICFLGSQFSIPGVSPQARWGSPRFGFFQASALSRSFFSFITSDAILRVFFYLMNRFLQNSCSLAYVRQSDPPFSLLGFLSFHPPRSPLSFYMSMPLSKATLARPFCYGLLADLLSFRESREFI